MNFKSKNFEPLITQLNSSLVKSRSLIFNQINVCYTTKIRSVKISNLLVNNMEPIFVLFWARELNITKRSKLKNALLKNRQVFLLTPQPLTPSITKMLACNTVLRAFLNSS